MPSLSTAAQIINTQVVSIHRFISIFSLILVLGSCVSLTDNGPEVPPAIDDQVSSDDALEASIKFGGKTLKNTVALIEKRNEWERVSGFLEVVLSEGTATLQAKEIANVAQLYIRSPLAKASNVFSSMVQSGRPVVRALGWVIATELPSKQTAQAIEKELSRALIDSDEKKVLIPEMARAVRSNQLKSVYTVIRLGLMESGSEEYAKTLISLDPKRASSDFMNYLSLVPVEELRQINFSSLDFYTAMTIMKHFEHFPPEASHAKSHHLYYFAVSRNIAISELAHKIIAGYMPAFKSIMAARLAGLPEWVQVAYVESARRNMTASIGILLRELKQTTGKRAVEDEIRSALRL